MRKSDMYAGILGATLMLLWIWLSTDQPTPQARVFLCVGAGAIVAYAWHMLSPLLERPLGRKGGDEPL